MAPLCQAANPACGDLEQRSQIGREGIPEGGHGLARGGDGFEVGRRERQGGFDGIGTHDLCSIVLLLAMGVEVIFMLSVYIPLAILRVQNRQRGA